MTPSTAFKWHYAKLWYAIGVALLALLLWGSLAPAATMPPLGSSDKFWHGLAYTTVMLWFAQLIPSLPKRLLLAVGLCLMGVAIEFIQPYVNRTFDWFDALANSVGVLFAVALSLSPLRKTLETIDSALAARRGGANTAR